MDAGTTFLRSDSDKHLWIIVSDPRADAETILIVNLTSLDARKENVCVLHVGDHPWIRHDTCVNYADAVVTSLTKLFAAKDAGAIVLHDPISDVVLRRIREGAMKSARISLDYADILINQGLVQP
ncbi:MAG TPA: hypothetical protein VK395_10735 [Gemmataceae bacterium]|nr:hypothetical protein [Gemmataceae bacterium]